MPVSFMLPSAGPTSPVEQFMAIIWGRAERHKLLPLADPMLPETEPERPPVVVVGTDEVAISRLDILSHQNPSPRT